MEKPATLLKLKLFHGCFSRFLSCTNGTKLHNESHTKLITYVINLRSSNDESLPGWFFNEIIKEYCHSVLTY